MLDINMIREKPELVRQALLDRQMDADPVDRVLALDEQRRALIVQRRSSSRPSATRSRKRSAR